MIYAASLETLVADFKIRDHWQRHSSYTASKISLSESMTPSIQSHFRWIKMGWFLEKIGILSRYLFVFSAWISLSNLSWIYFKNRDKWFEKNTHSLWWFPTHLHMIMALETRLNDNERSCHYQVSWNFWKMLIVVIWRGSCGYRVTQWVVERPLWNDSSTTRPEWGERGIPNDQKPMPVVQAHRVGVCVPSAWWSNMTEKNEYKTPIVHTHPPSIDSSRSLIVDHRRQWVDPPCSIQISSRIKKKSLLPKDIWLILSRPIMNGWLWFVFVDNSPVFINQSRRTKISHESMLFSFPIYFHQN